MYKNRYNSRLCKSKYNGSLENYKKEIAIKKMLRTINKRRIKYKFRLIVRLIFNK